MTSKSVPDAGRRQYEDINLTPAALSFFENVSRPGLQNRDTSSDHAAPPAAQVMEAISTMLDGRPDAIQILISSARRLGSDPPQHPEVRTAHQAQKPLLKLTRSSFAGLRSTSHYITRITGAINRQLRRFAKYQRRFPEPDLSASESMVVD